METLYLRLKSPVTASQTAELGNNAATCQAIITAVNRALEGWEDVLYRFDGGNGAQNSPWGEASDRPNKEVSAGKDVATC